MMRPHTLAAAVWACACLLTGLFTGAAAAQEEKNLTPQIQAYLHSPAHEEEDATQLKAMEEMYLPGCAATAKLSAISPALPLKLDDAGNAAAGSWKEVFAVTACDKNQQLNVFWDVDKAGKAHASPALPGGTVAPAEMQREASRKVLAATKAPSCKTARVDDTFFTRVAMGTAGKSPFKFAFDETWVVSACGQVLDVPVHIRFGNAEKDVAVTTDGAVAHATAPFAGAVRPFLTAGGISFINAARPAAAAPAARPATPAVTGEPPPRPAPFTLSLDATAPANVPPAAQAYLTSADHQNDVIRDAKFQFSEFFPDCAGGAAKLVAVAEARPLTVKDGKAFDGAWRETYAVDACGARKQVTLMWSVSLDGKLSENLGVVGATQIASPTLMNGVRTALVKDAQNRRPECQVPAVTDTRFDRDYTIPEMDANLRPKRVWQETWTVSVCDLAVDLRVLVADHGVNQVVHIDADEMAERLAK